MARDEEWRVCISAPHYEVSNSGRVRRAVQGLQSWAVPGSLLKPDINRDGHHRYTLFESGRRFRRFAHQLVCEAWHGSQPSPEHVVCHRDDVKSNNNPNNLYWGTHKDNGRDKVANGLSVRGERINTAKLTEAQVLEIRHRAAGGATNIYLAQVYGVPDSAISSIVRGKNWKHVGGPIVTYDRRSRKPMVAANANGRRAA